jgi:hypothetical protein
VTKELARRNYRLDHRRTCAAYVHLTGCWPSHRRRSTDEWLRQILIYDRSASTEGKFRLREGEAEAMSLDAHPMVFITRMFLQEGFQIAVSLRFDMASKVWAHRRPSDRIFLVKLSPDRRSLLDRVTVLEDGSWVDGW